MKTSLKAFSLIALSAVALSACGVWSGNPLRSETATRLAAPAWMVKREISAGDLLLTAYERMHEPGEVATLYIEGDGEADRYLNNAFDPTPVYPVALHLSSKDNAENLAYLARPCQYSKTTDEFCDAKDWQATKYSAGTLAAYNDAINKIKRRYDITSIHLVGYDSGATLAALLAAERKDVLSLRSVAGEFDMNALNGSLDALRTLPQHHFAGAMDTENAGQLNTYLAAIGTSNCIDYTLVQEAEHENGWADKWPELRTANMPICARPPKPEFVPIEKPEPIYYPRMSGSKK